MSVREYIGARYVPLFIGEWDSTVSYEPLSIVQHEGNSYTSRQHVPIGVDIDNEIYWAETGNYNAQIEQYRQEVIALGNDFTELETTLEGEFTELETDVNNIVAGMARDTQSIFAKNNAVFIGHGGLSGCAPNNSSIAVQKAGQYGFNGVEIDVRKTFDDVLVCIHNEDIEAYFNGSGYVSTYTYAQLLEYNYNAGSYVADYPNLKIMTLQECISICKLFGMTLFIDIKDEDIAEDVNNLVKANDIENMCVYIAGSGPIINNIKALENRIVPFFEVFTDSLTNENIYYAHLDGAAGVTCYSTAYDANNVTTLQNYGMQACVWVNASRPQDISYSEYKRCMDLGVNMFTVDSAEYMSEHDAMPRQYDKYALVYSNKVPIITPYGAKMANYFNHINRGTGKLLQNKLSTAYPNEPEFDLDNITYGTSVIIDSDFPYGDMILVGKKLKADGTYDSWQYQSPVNFANNVITHPINADNYSNTMQNFGVDWFIQVTHSICNEYVYEKVLEFLHDHVHIENCNVAIGSYTGNVFNTDHRHIDGVTGNRTICMDYIVVNPGQEYNVPIISGSNVRVSFRTYTADGAPQQDPGWKNQGVTYTIPANARFMELYGSRTDDSSFDYANFRAFERIWENIKLGR